MGLHGFALLTAWATFFLIFVGGLVTSTGSGLAVPDWPLSFGQFFPPMVGGVLYEHGHRMAAAFVGALTLVLTVWICLRETRKWVKALAVGALLAVVFQGVLGGITVLFLLPTPVSVAHALLAHTFFCLTVALAVLTGPRFKTLANQAVGEARSSLPRLCAATAIVIYGQLVLGALVRHTGAGLAIPDFPLAFGGLLPPMNDPTVIVHFLHRVGAVAVAAFIIWTLARVVRGHRAEGRLFRPALGMTALLFLELTLGAFTIWTQKAVLPTTGHVAIGGAILATSFVLTLRSYRLLALPKRRVGLGLVAEQVPA